MNQQQIENENLSYIAYHNAIRHAKVLNFTDIMIPLPPKPKYDFSEKIVPPTGTYTNMLDYVNGEEMPVGIELRDDEFCIIYGKTCNFMEQLIVTRVVHTSKYFYKTYDDYRLQHWWKFWK